MLIIFIPILILSYIQLYQQNNIYKERLQLLKEKILEG